MAQKYIVGDVVMYDNKIMVVKEPRDGCHFDLSCPKEWLVYCFVGVEDIKPVVLTTNILRKNRWFPLDERFVTFIKGDIKITTQAGISMLRLEKRNRFILNMSMNFNIFSLVWVLKTKWRCRYVGSIINNIHSYRNSIYVCRHKNL